MNKFCCHGALFLWQLQHFMNMGCLSNTVTMATFTRFLLKITANLIDKICYYASCINELSLNDSKKLWCLTLFTCLLLNIVQNVVKSLFSAGGPNILYAYHVLVLNRLTGVQTGIFTNENDKCFCFSSDHSIILKCLHENISLGYAVVIWTHVQKFTLESLVGIKRQKKSDAHVQAGTTLILVFILPVAGVILTRPKLTVIP